MVQHLLVVGDRAPRDRLHLLEAPRCPDRDLRVRLRAGRDALRRRLGTDIRVTLRAKGKGQIHIAFYSNDDLARLMEIILGAPFAG